MEEENEKWNIKIVEKYIKDGKQKKSMALFNFFKKTRIEEMISQLEQARKNIYNAINICMNAYGGQGTRHFVVRFTGNAKTPKSGSAINIIEVPNGIKFYEYIATALRTFISLEKLYDEEINDVKEILKAISKKRKIEDEEALLIVEDQKKVVSAIRRRVEELNNIKRWYVVGEFGEGDKRKLAILDISYKEDTERFTELIGFHEQNLTEIIETLKKLNKMKKNVEKELQVR